MEDVVTPMCIGTRAIWRLLGGVSNRYALKRYSERAILEGAGEPRAADKDSGHETRRRRANHAYRRWSGGAHRSGEGPAHDGDSRGG